MGCYLGGASVSSRVHPAASSACPRPLWAGAYPPARWGGQGSHLHHQHAEFDPYYPSHYNADFHSHRHSYRLADSYRNSDSHAHRHSYHHADGHQHTNINSYRRAAP